MKTNKFWSIIMMLAMVFGTSITFSSCGDDDDEPVIKSESNSSNGDDNGSGSNSNVKSALVGAWSPNNGGEVFEFQNNGVFKYYDNYSYSNGTNDEDNWTGTWTYNQSSSTVVINDTEQGKSYTIEIISITNTSLVMKFNGSTQTMSKVTKQGSAQSKSIVGLWHSEPYDAESGNYMILYLGTDGRGYCIENDNSLRNEDWFTYSVKGEIVYITDADDDEWVITYKMAADGKSAVVYGLDDNDLAVLTFYRQ